MPKLLFLCRRRPDVTHARYVDLLLGSHVPLALAHHPTMRGYVVNVVEEVPAGAAALDSIGELIFDTLDDYRVRLYDSPEGEAAIRRDVAGFLGGADAYVTTEHVQVAPPGPRPRGRSPGVKLLCPVMRRPDLSHEAFVAHWLERHVPLARAHHPGLVRYVTNVVDARLTETGEAWDGFAELHFAPAEVLAGGLFGSAEGERIVRDDIARFIGRALAYRMTEYVERVPV